MSTKSRFTGEWGWDPPYDYANEKCSTNYYVWTIRCRSTQVFQQTISQKGMIRTICTFLSKILGLTFCSLSYLTHCFSLSVCSLPRVGAKQMEQKGPPGILASPVRPALKEKLEIGPHHWTPDLYLQDLPKHSRTNSYYSSNINSYSNDTSSWLRLPILWFLQSTDHWGGNTALCLAQWSYLTFFFNTKMEETMLETVISGSVWNFWLNVI